MRSAAFNNTQFSGLIEFDDPPSARFIPVCWEKDFLTLKWKGAAEIEW